MGEKTKIYKLKINCSEWAGEIVSNIFDRMIQERFMPLDQEKAQQFINIIAEEIDKRGEQVCAIKEQKELQQTH